MFYRNCSIYDATPISRCPRVHHFIGQESKMQYAITLSNAAQERYTRKLDVHYDAVGGSSTSTVLTDPLTDPDEILPEKWSDSISSWRPVEFGDI